MHNQTLIWCRFTSRRDYTWRFNDSLQSASYRFLHQRASLQNDSRNHIPSFEGATSWLSRPTKRSWTQAEDDTLIDLHIQKGLTLTEVATYFPERTYAAVKEHWNTVVKPKIPKKDIPPPPTRPKYPDGRTWQRQEIDFLVQKRQDGTSWGSIAKALGRAISSVYTRAEREVAAGLAPATIITARTNHLRPEHNPTILNGLRNNLTFPQIAELLGQDIRPTSVYYHYRRMLERDPAVRKEFENNRSRRQRFSLAEDEVLLQGYQSGRKFGDIAKDLNRTPAAVYRRISYMRKQGEQS